MSESIVRSGPLAGKTRPQALGRLTPFRGFQVSFNHLPQSLIESLVAALSIRGGGYRAAALFAEYAPMLKAGKPCRIRLSYLR
jgi:hypothetical protein